MINCYQTQEKVLKGVEEKAKKYDSLINRINRGMKKHRTLAKMTKNEDYNLAYSMIADYLKELKEEKGGLI